MLDGALILICDDWRMRTITLVKAKMKLFSLGEWQQVTCRFNS